MTAPPLVANSGEDAIMKELPSSFEPTLISDSSESSLEEAYEIEATLEQIKKGNYQRVALQFPDELLHDAVAVYKLIRDGLEVEKELYILADTTYGSCCVDEVAAQHVDADIIVHYGHTCLSSTARLPVIYVLTKRAIDPSHAANALASSSKSALDDSKAIVLMYDVSLAHQAERVHEELEKTIVTKPIILSRIDRSINSSGSTKGKGREDVVLEVAASPSATIFATPSATTTTSEEDENNTPADGVSDIAPAPTPAGLVPSDELPQAPTSKRVLYDLPNDVEMKDCAIFYLGGESLGLNNLLMTNGSNPVWSYDPATRMARLESSKTNRMLMRRYAVVEKAKDADVIGILVGTLGVAAYLPLITHLRKLISSHQKKSYTIAVGKLNPAKLANFMEVECFVLVACPENTLIDSKEFLRPIVTPYELELALTSKSWTGEYILDFSSLLSSSTFGQDYVEPGFDEVDEDGPKFSSVTGTYRHPKRYTKNGVTDADDLEKQAKTLSIRNPASAVAQVLGSAAGDFLSNRTYKGLTPRYGMDAPSVVEEGRSGIARGYGDERDSKTTPL